MMNDRFSAELRQHLLSTADERPGDGRLAAIVEGVAVTAQRPRLVTRLPWSPARVERWPSATVRYGLIAAAITIAIVAAALAGGLGQGRRSVFEGTWTAIDAGDGSRQTVVIGAGPRPAVTYTDDLAGGTACAAEPVKVFTAEGAGEIDGDRLDVSWPAGGGCGLGTVPMGDGFYAYDHATDTLLDGLGATWVRAQHGVAPPTPAPVATPSPSSLVARPTIAGGCYDVPAGATYGNNVFPISLNVTIPADAAITWESFGGPEFELMGDCDVLFSNSGPIIEASIVSYVDGTCETGDTVAVDTAAEAAVALTGARGAALSQPASTSLGGHAATRFEIAPDARVCFPGVNLWNGFDVQGGEIFYLVDVDGLPLGITITDIPAADRVSATAEAEAIVASLRMDAIPGVQPVREPVPTPDPSCIQLDGTGTYTAPVGSVSVSATVPDDPATYWSGVRRWFGLSRSPCGLDSPLYFQTLVITRVAADACRGLGDSVEVHTAAEAAAALADQASTDVTGRTDVIIGGHPAVRLQIGPQSGLDTSTCNEGAALLLGQTVEDPFVRIDWTYTVYLIDVGGTIVAINPVIDGAEGVAEPALLDEIDAIIGSLELK